MRFVEAWSARRQAVVAALAMILVPVGAARAEPQESAVERGQRLFEVHCRSCHGDAGRGDGPMAAELERPPVDLTRLADGDGFDAEAVRRAVDGRMEVTGHEVRQMPVWGLTFQVRGSDGGRPEEVEGRLDDLVAFLASIQASKVAPEGP